ncbi:MAG: thermonuclease family protein [Aquificae bacterium]|nr:thermonuclease family protein [Aquificota bacterium]
MGLLLVFLGFLLTGILLAGDIVPCKVVRVVDGDTVRCLLPDGKVKRVRLMGIDTLETKGGRKATRQARWFKGGLSTVKKYGLLAKDLTERLVKGKKVYLEVAIRKKDRNGRILAYLWLDPERTLMLNEILVRRGLAFVYIIPPQVKYLSLLGEAQEEAQERRAGFWEKFKF